MLFNSGVFLKFFAGFLLLYWLVRNNLRARNILIVAASYLFYGWWDYRFLGLILLSSVLDYFVGLGYNLSGASLVAPRREKAMRQSTEANFAGTEFVYVANVTRQYLAVIRAQDGMTLTESELQRADENLKFAQGKVAVGNAIPLAAERTGHVHRSASSEIRHAMIAAPRLNYGRGDGVPAVAADRSDARHEYLAASLLNDSALRQNRRAKP